MNLNRLSTFAFWPHSQACIKWHVILLQLVSYTECVRALTVDTWVPGLPQHQASLFSARENGAEKTGLTNCMRVTFWWFFCRIPCRVVENKIPQSICNSHGQQHTNPDYFYDEYTFNIEKYFFKWVNHLVNQVITHRVKQRELCLAPTPHLIWLHERYLSNTQSIVTYPFLNVTHWVGCKMGYHNCDLNSEVNHNLEFPKT